MKKAITVLFVARLQPLHRGHIHAIKSIIRKFGKIVIAIGSEQESRTSRNPFSFKERKAMLRKVLEKEGIAAKIIGVRDFHDDAKWAKAVERRCKFDVVVTGNAWTRRCFRGKYPVKTPDLLKPEKYSSTRVRMMMRKEKRWKGLVPKKIYEYIKKKKLEL